MTDNADIREALLQLTQDVTEHTRYLRELGVELFDAGEPGSAVQTTVPQRVSASPSSTRSNALARNAVAETRIPSPSSVPTAPSQSSSLTPTAESLTLTSNIEHRTSDSPASSSAPLSTSPTASTNATASPAPDAHAQPRATPTLSPNASPTAKPSLFDETIMPKKNTTGPTRDELPPPQETLFGEITPADEESLPRRDETIGDIRNDIGECTRCPLYASRTKVVHSDGNFNARLMFVGEAPGADEDASGKPFVGRAGQLLNKIIEAIGMKREDVFIGNVNRCRPPQNRTPTPDEAKTCKPFLLREIAIVQPAVIVVLGNTAMKNLLDTKEGITKLRGQFQDYRGIKVMPTFHPAYLLRDPSKKRETWEDMKKVREYLNTLPRKPKQPEAAAQKQVGLEQRDENG